MLESNVTLEISEVMASRVSQNSHFSVQKDIKCLLTRRCCEIKLDQRLQCMMHDNVREAGITSPGCIPAYRKYLVMQTESVEEREIHSLT